MKVRGCLCADSTGGTSSLFFYPLLPLPIACMEDRPFIALRFCAIRVGSGGVATRLPSLCGGDEWGLSRV